MDVKFENLAKIDLLIDKIEKLELKLTGEKRWLNISETANYLGYSKDHIHRLKNDSFILGLHYHKKSGKLLFDKLELDKWVTFDSNTKEAVNIANEVLKDILWLVIITRLLESPFMGIYMKGSYRCTKWHSQNYFHVMVNYG